MPSRIEHRASFSAPATSVHSALVDRTFVAAKLAAIGGSSAELLDHTVSSDRVTFRVRQGVPADQLPSLVRSFLKGDLEVTRDETWRAEPGRFTGTVHATIPGVPGEIKGRMRLTDLGDGGSEWVTTAEVRVGIPLVGGKLEGLVAEQVSKLLANESEFTGKWLAEHGS